MKKRVKLTTAIDEKLIKDAKIYSIENGIRLNELLEIAIVYAIENDLYPSKTGKTESVAEAKRLSCSGFNAQK